MNERDLEFIQAVNEGVGHVLKRLRNEFKTEVAELKKSLESQSEQHKQAISELKRLIPERQELIDAVTKGMASVPTSQELAEHIRQEVAALPAPADGKDGKDGKSVTVDDVRPVLEEMVKTAVASLPPPKNGKDYDPDVLQQAVEKAVNKAVADIPVPADGKSVTAEDVAPMLQQLVDDRFASLPPARDGKDYDPDVLQTAVDKAVDKAVSAIPVPADGKSVTVDDVRPILQEMVTAAVPDVESLVKTAAAALPAPEPGRPGEDGRDALQLEILPEIDPEKSCPRGTYAIHDGGLWRAYEKTHDMRGWECLVEGIKNIDVALSEDQREISVMVQQSSGRGVTKTFSVPVTIYRGVFKSGIEYRPGDTVTWAGSVWHCHSVTSDKPGEPGCQGWTLAVKRGRDGRDKKSD